jgi:hypothetical protein
MTMADPILGVTFKVTTLVSVDIQGLGKGCGAKEANCNDHTKVMLLELYDNGDLEKLKKALSDKIDNPGIEG